jgi:hypothetical protein
MIMKFCGSLGSATSLANTSLFGYQIPSPAHAGVPDVQIAVKQISAMVHDHFSTGGICSFII